MECLEKLLYESTSFRPMGQIDSDQSEAFARPVG